MEDFNDFDELDRQIEAEAAQNSRFQNLLKLTKDGDSVTFRFLREALPYKQFKEHSNYDENNKTMCFQAVCAAEVGQPCSYCAQYDKTGEKAFKVHTSLVYPVFIQDWQNPRATMDRRDYLEKQVAMQKLWIIKLHSKQTDHHKIRDYFKRCGTVLSSEWQYSRRGEKKSTTYSLAGYPASPNNFDLMSEEDTWELLLKTLPPKTVEAEEDAA